MNIALLLEMAASSEADRVALGSRHGGLTYAELLARVRAAAAHLEATGADRVVLVDVNSEAVPIALFAAGMAGMAFAPVNYRLAESRLRDILARTVPAVAIVSEDAIQRVAGVDGLSVMTRRTFLDAAEESAEPSGRFVAPDEVAVLLFTSGTTGEPKAAVLRHEHLTSYVVGSVEFLGAASDEAALISVPPYHIAGISAVLSSVYAGRRIVYVAQFDPPSWVGTAQEELITHAMVVPTMLDRILDHVEESGASLPALRHLSYGGGRMPPSVIERAMRLLPHVGFVNAYGLTETSSTVAVLTPEDHRAALASDDPTIRGRLGSVGRALPGVEVEVRDVGGEPVATGQRGEIWVRGEQVSGEYDGVGTGLTPDGWFQTHDGGWMDDEGYLFVEGRLDDVIVRGGENLSPGEIEDVLLAHPAVTDVAVVGIPDDEWGESVAAFVVLEHGTSVTSEELQDWVGSRLRSSRRPSIVEMRVELPYTATGKLLRRVLRDEWVERRRRERGTDRATA